MRFSLFWLAAKLGIWDPDQLGAVMSGPLLEEWIAFYGVKSEKEKQAFHSSKE